MPRVPFDPATDYYGLLGVVPSASPEEIQASYRRLAKAYHPDLNAGSSLAAARMARVNVAKSVLLDPAARAAYDQLRRLRTVPRVVRTVYPNGAPARPVQYVGRTTGPHPSRPTYGQPRGQEARRPPWPSTARAAAYVPVGVVARSHYGFDRGTGILLMIAMPLLAALLVYVVQAAQVAGRPARPGPSDLALPAVVGRPTARGVAEAAFLVVNGQPPSRLLGQRAYNIVQNRSDASPESELLRAAARRLVQAGAAADVQAWDQAVNELCLLADRC